MDTYNSIVYSTNDTQVVPDDGYNSPVHSPFYTFDSAKSPASSVTSIVDSAFDELAEVIPEYLDTDVESQNMYNPVILNPYLISNPNMYTTPSPCSDSGYVEAPSPSSSLMQAVEEEASAKRSFSEVEPSIINLDYFNDDEPRNKRPMTDSGALAVYAAMLSTQNYASDQKSPFMAASEDSGDDAYSFKSAPDETPEAENLSELMVSRPIIPDDKELVSRFSILAKYMDAKPYQEPQKTELKNMSQNPANIETEVPREASVVDESNVKREDTAFDYGSSPQASNIMLTQWVERALQSQSSQVSGFSQTNQSTLLSKYVENATNQTQQQATEKLVVVQLRKELSQKPSGVVFFNVSKEKETVKAPENSQVHTRIADPIDHQQLISKWKPPKVKKPSLVSHSSKPRLYNFLLDLLSDPNARCIEWLNEEQGIFKFIKSSEVARLWGLRKNKPHMKYENFARSLRTYVAKGILTKPRNKLVYQFMPDYY